MKTYIVIFIAAASAAVGESFLSYAMKKNGQMDMSEFSHWINLILSVVRNPFVSAGVIFLAVFFFLYLAALSWADLSLVLPLTAMSYIFAALLAKFFLKEDVTWLRWAGTAVIIFGIMLVALDGGHKASDGSEAKSRGEGKGFITGSADR